MAGFYLKSVFPLFEKLSYEKIFCKYWIIFINIEIKNKLLMNIYL